MGGVEKVKRLNIFFAGVGDEIATEKITMFCFVIFQNIPRHF